MEVTEVSQDAGALTLVLLQILMDTKHLQKEINALTGKLDRTFAVTDEVVFKVTPPVCLFGSRTAAPRLFLLLPPGRQERRVCA